MFTFAYPAVFKRDENERLLVGFSDFPTAHTDGTDANEAMEEAIDCLGSSIAFAMADKADVPKPSRVKRGQKLVPVPLWIVGKLALYSSGQSEPARRLKVRETVVRRREAYFVTGSKWRLAITRSINPYSSAWGGSRM